MSFSTTSNRIPYTGDGVQTVFAYTFLIYNKTHLEVRVDGVLKVVDTDYTVSNVGVAGGGNVTFTVAPPNLKQVLILRVVPTTQEIVYQPNDRFPEKTHEKGLDLGMMAVQQFDEKIKRAIKLPVTSTLTDIDLPVAVTGQELIRWNAAKTALELIASGSLAAGTLSPITTRGDLIRGSSLNTPERLALGASGTVVGSDGTDVKYLTTTDIVEVIVKRLRETGGPTTLLAGAIPDLSFLQRSGTALIGSFPLFSGFTGLGLANNGADPTNDIDIAVGAAVSNDAVLADRRVMNLASALTKQLDVAWAVGNNAGMRDTGSIADGWWHIFLIKRTDTGVVDVLASVSATAPTMPTNYDKKKWIGAIHRNAAAIRTFFQRDDTFLWKFGGVLDVNATNPGTSAVSRTLTTPLGVKTWALMNVLARAAIAANVNIYLSSLDTDDVAASLTAAPLATLANNSTATASDVGTQAEVLTNASSQIRSRLESSDANTIMRISTYGWRVDRAEVV